VEPLDLLNSLGGDIPSEGNREIVPESEKLATLILQIVDELAVLAILASQSLLELEDGRVNLASTVLKEHVLDIVESLFTNRHHHWRHISRALGALWQATLLVSNLKNFSHLRVEFLVQCRVKGVNVRVCEQSALRKEFKEDATTFTELQTGRWCRRCILLWLFLSISSFSPTLFRLNRVVLILRDFKCFLELGFKD